MARKKLPKQYDKHHRKPSSRGGGSKERNISIVPRRQHQAWHTLFSNLSPETISAIINEKWIDPDFEFICIKKDE